MLYCSYCRQELDGMSMLESNEHVAECRTDYVAAVSRAEAEEAVFEQWSSEIDNLILEIRRHKLENN